MNERRVVVLGASNAALGISTLVETAQLVLGGPIDLLAAIGFGRSYGMTSRVLVRTLPGIVDCGLWHDLSKGPPVPTFALLTDIGNDIIYGADVERIAAWVEACLERLAPICCRVIVTELPIESVLGLGKARFRLFRRLFFPGSRVSLHEARARAEALNARVVELAQRYGGCVQRQQAAWYGLDPVHLRRRCWSEAWRKTLAPWCDDVRGGQARGSLARWLTLWHQKPLSRRWFGIHLQRKQPTCALPDGSSVSLY